MQAFIIALIWCKIRVICLSYNIYILYHIISYIVYNILSYVALDAFPWFEFCTLVWNPVTFIETQTTSVSCFWYYLFMSWAWARNHLAFYQTFIEYESFLVLFSHCSRYTLFNVIYRADIFSLNLQMATSDTGCILNFEIKVTFRSGFTRLRLSRDKALVKWWHLCSFKNVT